MNKEVLRKEYLAKRKSITSKENKSQIICEKLLKMDCVKEAETIAVYYSLEDEVNTIWLIQKLLASKKKVLLPKVISKDNMIFIEVKNISELEKGKFGILEPKYDKSNIVDITNIQVVIIPGIAFDKNKNRIGYGKGYYDTYLSNSNKVIKIGICFDECVIENKTIDVTKHDIPLDYVITENREI